jgi:hypothetical protein
VEVIDIKGQTGMTEMTREVAAASGPGEVLPVPAAKPTGSFDMRMIHPAGWLAAALAAAGGGLWWFRRRRTDAAALQPVVLGTAPSDSAAEIARDLDDETVFRGAPRKTGQTTCPGKCRSRRPS